jgi:hypothetical protein
MELRTLGEPWRVFGLSVVCENGQGTLLCKVGITMVGYEMEHGGCRNGGGIVVVVCCCHYCCSWW